MALSIIRTDQRGAYRMIAEEDLYLDESMTRIIVVKSGDKVPKDAAFVLAGKGGTIPTRYADMLKTLDAPAEVKGEVSEVKVEPETKPTAQTGKPKAKPEAPKSNPSQETPAQ